MSRRSLPGAVFAEVWSNWALMSLGCRRLSRWVRQPAVAGAAKASVRSGCGMRRPGQSRGFQLGAQRPSPARMTVRMERESVGAGEQAQLHSTVGSFPGLVMRSTGGRGGLMWLCHFSRRTLALPSGCAARGAPGTVPHSR